MEVKIGVQYAPRELVLESAQSPSEVEATVSDALGKGEGVLSTRRSSLRHFRVQAQRNCLDCFCHCY